MPTILREAGFRFYFYSRENDEPPHIHVEHGDKLAKYWLDPVDSCRRSGFARTNLARFGFSW